MIPPPSEPFSLFGAWFAEADACPEIRYAHAACLATVDADGAPDARTVLIKAWDESGFVIFTDARSPKARQLEACPRAALVLPWQPLERQVRIRGSVEEASAETADACFAHRPRGSRITAWASRQSEILPSREDLERRAAEHEARFADVEVPRPPSWRAWKVVPEEIEFWSARRFRRHERVLYTRRGDGWERVELEP